MPDVRDGESRKNYVSRCIPVVMNEDSEMEVDHAAAKCHGMYDQHLKKKRKKKRAKS